jgi:hypothetical protein
MCVTAIKHITFILLQHVQKNSPTFSGPARKALHGNLHQPFFSIEISLLCSLAVLLHQLNMAQASSLADKIPNGAQLRYMCVSAPHVFCQGPGFFLDISIPSAFYSFNAF